jgi:hypothetical protein
METTMALDTVNIPTHAKVEWLDGLVEYVPTSGRTPVDREESLGMIRKHYSEDGRVKAVEGVWNDVGRAGMRG